MPRSLLASVFAVLFVLSVSRGEEGSRIGPKDLPASKLSPFEQSFFGPLVCVPHESYTFALREKAKVRGESTTARCARNMAARSPSLSRYPIDTLDPPLS